MRKSPSISKLFLTDYYFFMGVLMFIIGIGISAYTYFGDTNIFIAVTFACTASIGLGLSIWRTIFTHKIFQTGAEAEGFISNVWFYRSRANVKFTYTFGSIEYKTSNILVRNSKTTKMTTESKVLILVNPSNPKQALIVDVYQ